MKSKQQFIVVSLIILCAVCVLVILYFYSTTQSEINLAKDVDQEVSESRSQITDASTTPPVAIVSESGNIKKSEESNVAPLDWPVTVNRKYGFSYRQAYEDSLYVNIYTSDVPLDVYVKNIWTLNKNDLNLYTKDKTVSEIVQTEINGSEAYQFTLSKSFTWDEGGYILEEPYLYTFFETAQDIKVIARVPVSDSYHQAVLNSFIVDESLIPANEAPSNWQPAQHTFYKFKFPTNLFSINKEFSIEERLYLQDKVEGMRGGISITLIKEKFDPSNIQDMYGEIKNPEKVTVGGITWYTYLWGDAGASARMYVTGIDATHTLKVSFGSMWEEEVYPVVDDVALQRLILETFTF